MDKVRIDVSDDLKLGIDDLLVSLSGVDFNVDTTLGKSVRLWLKPSDADRLCFQLNAVLQDRQRLQKK